MKKSIYSEKQRRLCVWLVQSRKRAGLTQAALAGKLGKPQSFVAKYENGERRVDVIELVEITRVLGANAADILKKLA